MSNPLIRQLLSLGALWILTTLSLTSQDNNSYTYNNPLLSQSYEIYKQNNNIDLIRRVIVSHINHPQFEQVLEFYKTKDEPNIDKVSFLILESFSKFELIQKIYFKKPSDKEKYLESNNPIYREIYYKSFLFNFEFEKLMNEILTQVQKSHPLDMEIRFLKLISDKKINPQRLFATIDNFDFKSANNVSPTRTKNIIKTIILFYFKKYDLAYRLNLELQKQEKNPKFISSFKPLEIQFQNYQTSFLDWLYNNGYYQLVVNLHQGNNQTKNISAVNLNRFSPEKIKKAIFLSRIDLPKKNQLYDDEPFNLYSWTIKRNLLYQNKYQELINYHLKQDDGQYSLYLLALAANGSWSEYTFLVNKTPLEERKFYLWLKLLFEDPQKALSASKSINADLLNHWQVEYLNLVDEYKDENIEIIAEIIRRLIIVDHKLEDDLNEQKDKLPTGLFEYAISQITHNYFLKGDFVKCQELFELYYHLFTNPNFKEKIMLYHGISKMIDDPVEGKKILYKLLYINPKSVYRFEIEESFELLL